MSKAAKTVAEKLAQLRNIPPNLLPSTLKHKLVLPNITEMRFEYSKSARTFGPLYLFYRKYIADLRHHNPHMKIVRSATEDGPMVARLVLASNSSKASEEDMTIICNQVKSL